MNETVKHKIIVVLHIIDTHGMKPNYADIARRLGHASMTTAQKI